MSDHPEAPRRGRSNRGVRRHRVGMIPFVVVGAIVCLLLGYWQLSRWNSNTGSFQNLGYSFQWPFFAAFLVFAYRRFVRLEAEREEEDARWAEGGSASGDADDGEDSTGSPRVRPAAAATEIPADLLPRRRREVQPEQDETLRAYNDYLAELHRGDAAPHTQQENRTA